MSLGMARNAKQSLMLRRAVVRENKDPEKQGRVRVEYPWFHGNSAEIPSEWARMVLPYASAEHGMWSLPEVGDEVLVYFENGNLDYPIIMGSLYSALKKPPTSGRGGDFNGDNENSLKFMKTKSGHLLCFDDSSASQAIVIKDKDNRRFEILSKEKKIVISDEKDNSIEIEGSAITIKNSSGSKVAIDGSSITVDAASVTIAAASSISLGQAAAFSLIKGELFQTLFNTHTHVTAWGPSSPPMMPMTPAMMSMKTKTE